MQIDAKSKKAMHFISLIKQYQELALTTRETGEFLGRRTEITWEHGEGDLIERSESKGDVSFQLADYYEKRVFNLERLLKELIETLDQPLTLPINLEDMMVLHPAFQRILWDSVCPSPIDPWV